MVDVERFGLRLCVYPNLEFHTEVDALKHTTLVRGMVLALGYADENGGIGLTKSDAMKEIKHKTETEGRFPPGCGTHRAVLRADMQTGG